MSQAEAIDVPDAIALCAYVAMAIELLFLAVPRDVSTRKRLRGPRSAALILALGAMLIDCGGTGDGCDDALETLCACETADCSEETSSTLVRRLRECIDNDDQWSDVGLATCINEAGPKYCEVLDGLTRRDGSLCEISCRDACDLAPMCDSYRYAECDTGQSP